jgi:hypothetical protein
MSLITGSPYGSGEVTEEIYLYGSPFLYVQDSRANPRYNPDADGFYWGMSGTTTYPYRELGCPSDVSFSENITINEVLCDNVGTKATIQQRNYLTLTFTLKSFFPLTTLSMIMKGGPVVETPPTQKFGFGPIDNNLFWIIYGTKVYDETVGDYVWIHLHRAQFVDAWTVNMPFGDAWNIALQLRAYADTTKPSASQFGVFGRLDPSVIT